MSHYFLLSGYPNLHTNGRFRDSAAKLNIELKTLSPDSTDIPEAKAVLLRLGVTSFNQGLKLAQKLENQGSKLINCLKTVQLCKNKWDCHQHLSAANIPQLETALIKQEEELINLKYPLVLKTLYGSKGVGVHLCQNLSEALEHFRNYQKSGYYLLQQDYLQDARELRVFTVGEKIRAVVGREKADGDFRANWHRGGSYSNRPNSLSSQDNQTINSVINALNLDYSAIDLIEEKGEWKVLEVNDSPGLEGIEKVLNLDLATEIIQHMLKNS